MKKLISITSTVMSLALAFNFFSVSCVKAAQVELYGLRKNMVQI